MDRRKVLKAAAVAVAGGGAGLFALLKVFNTGNPVNSEPYKLEYNNTESNWQYAILDPGVTAELAYRYYNEGSCMYATIKSVISQLAEMIGEPFTSFPCEMFKYGHGGIGGYGSVCGALNGAAALTGLLISGKSVQDNIIADIFQWYEKESIPVFKPQNPHFDFTPPTSISNSVLCHASNTNWSNKAGLKIDSNERKERCRRLTGDVAKKVTMVFNEIFSGAYITNTHSNEAVNTCVSCHGKEGKLNNTAVKMSCNSCHSESIAHKIFADGHYILMK
ncbi:MAG: C-GCAxxG-C-C family protein [Prolixibacteraceae bacterium]|nr:C-GCAxxG-C-C family protein [Prolixibacteraceae bacterium]